MYKNTPRLFGVASAAVALFFLLATEPAFAAKPIPKIRVGQLLQDHSLRNVNNNLRRMATTLPTGTEKDALWEIHGLGTDASTAMGSLVVLAAIYQRMVNGDDKAEVSGWAAIELDHTKTVLDNAVDGVNDYLTALNSPATVAEAQRLRDRMLELRAELERYQYDK
jgi:hypothetical protein